MLFGGGAVSEQRRVRAQSGVLLQLGHGRGTMIRIKCVFPALLIGIFSPNLSDDYTRSAVVCYCSRLIFSLSLVDFSLSLSDETLFVFLFLYSMNENRRRGRTRKLPRGVTRKLAKNTGQPRTARRRGKARAIGRKSGPRNTSFRFT